MAKVISLKDASNEALISELSKRLGANSADSGEDFPDPKTIKKMKDPALDELCEKLNLDASEKDTDEKREMLLLVHAIMNGGEDLDKDGVKALCTALGIKPVKDVDANVKAIQDLLGSDSEEEGESEESEEGESEEAEESEDSEEAEEGEEAEEESESEEGEESEEGDSEDGEAEESEEAEEGEESEEEEGEEAEEGESEEGDAEAVDPAEVVKENLKYPKNEKDMQTRIDAFNKLADKGDKIDVKKAGGLKKAYAKMCENLVDDDGSLAQWGKPYIKNSEGYCCGLSMKNVKLKGDKTEYGKCLITGKYFSLDDEGNFVEKEK